MTVLFLDDAMGPCKNLQLVGGFSAPVKVVMCLSASLDMRGGLLIRGTLR